MSTVTSCTLLSGRPAAAASSASARLSTGGKAALPCFQKKSRPLSLCFANNPTAEHSPKTDLPPFNISPVALVLHPESPREDRWKMKEDAHAVNMSFHLPGLDKEDLVVELDEDVLVIRKKPKSDEDGGVYARLLVPAGYIRESVEAELDSGVLRVTITKVKQHARRRINVEIHVK